MRRALRRLIPVICALASVLTALAATAQSGENVIPDRRVAISRNVDFYSSDLANIFDTTLDACQAACLANPRCSAFTFNERSGACFPKEGVSQLEPYDGAISARIYPTSPDVLANASDRVASLDFLTSRDLDAARRLAETIGRLHSVDENSALELIRAAQAARVSGNMTQTLRLTGAAIALTDQADLWTEYARLARTESFGDLTSRIRGRGLSAAINAYLRAPEGASQVNALIELAEALEDRERGRRMIDALRLAQSISPRRDTEALLTEAIGKYGFRVSDTQVDSDAAQPRICAVFNEALVRTGVDYSTYVQMPDPALTVTAEGSQICIDGVRHGTRATFTLREGLPAASGETLARSVELTLYVRDRAPSLRFVSRAYVLPRMGEVAIPVEAVNLTEADLTLYRVSDRAIIRSIQDNLFASPLYEWEQDRFERNIGTEIWSGTADLPTELNRDITARLPMSEAIADQPAGVYVLRAAIPEADQWENPPAFQWFILSDHGLTTMQGVDGLTVSVRSLADTSATEGAQVTLLSRANAVLGEAVTDTRGIARFDPGLTRGTGAAEPALITVTKADDMAFLSLTGPAFDLSDRGVEGREPAPPIDVFLTTDRGAYRAGETIHVTALTRDEQVRALPGVPLTAILRRPDGVEYSRQISTGERDGGHVFSLPVDSSAPRGPWTVALHVDPDEPALRATTVLVEDFLPERIDFDMDLPDVLPAAGGDMGLSARYLFGAPGAGLAVEGEARLSPARTLSDYPGYSFGRHDDRPGARTMSFSSDTDLDGTALVTLELPNLSAPGWPMALAVTTRVSEASGRPVERRAATRVLPQTDLIGIRPGFDGVLPENGTAEFSLIALDPDLAPKTMDVTWTVNRVSTRYQWYRIDGRWDWEPITTRERVETGTATLGATPVTVSAPVTWGAYEIVVERADGAYLSSSDSFFGGWYVPEDSGTTPDFLDLSLDATSYAPGDTANLRIVPRYAGTALITVMSNRIIHMEAVEVPKGATVIPLDVTEDWGAGAYVSAAVVRPMELETGRNPARSLGLAYAAVAPGDRALTVDLLVPDEVAPRGPMQVRMRIDGVREMGAAHVTLAAVDVGILNLTGFDSPDPQGHYFGQRRLGIELRDIYGRLIDGSQGALGQVRSGGDASAVMGTESPPPTEELVAFFSGPVSVDMRGEATVTFDLPAFNGTVRLMAVAWSAEGVGQAEADVLVRDPIVVAASVPRFLAPGDRTEMLLELTHAKGPTGPLDLSLRAEGIALAGAAPSQLTIGEGETIRLRLPLAAVGVGDHTLKVNLTTPGGDVLTKDLTIPVRLNDPEVSRQSRFTLAAGETFTFDDQVFDALQPGTGSAVLSVGPLARFDAPGLLATLDRYPYGCTEQLTSRALPLLYFDGVARAMDLPGADQVDTRITQAVTRILARQGRNGSFGLWRTDSGDLWLDAYVTDFLSRARARGHEVPDQAFESAVDNLLNRVNSYPDFDAETGGRGGDLAYALMVLAREGAASIGDLRYYADEKAADFGTPIAMAQLGAALSFYGEQVRADRMFARAARLVETRMAAQEAAVWRADYGTSYRDAAAVLTLALESGSAALNTETFSNRLARAGQRVSTQEAVWTLLATNALINDLRDTGITVDGQSPDGPLVRLRDARTSAAPVAIANNSDEATELTVTTFGVPVLPEPQGGNGYSIRRDYYTIAGNEADLTNLSSGNRLVVVLTVTPFGRQEARLMVDDPLPAGFEIDNPNLLQSGDIGALDWLQTTWTQSVEFRSDRFLAAVDRRTDEPFRLAYIVRAVSPGDYHHPAAIVEDMYRPQMRAWTDTGRITVTE